MRAASTWRRAAHDGTAHHHDAPDDLGHDTEHRDRRGDDHDRGAGGDHDGARAHDPHDGRSGGLERLHGGRGHGAGESETNEPPSSPAEVAPTATVGGQLPTTGANTFGMVLVAVALLAGGFCMVQANRPARRRS